MQSISKSFQLHLRGTSRIHPLISSIPLSLVQAAISCLDYFSSLLVAPSASIFAHLEFVLSRVSRGSLRSTFLKKPLFWHPVTFHLILLRNQSHNSDLKCPVLSDLYPITSLGSSPIPFPPDCSTPAALASLLPPGFLPFKDLCSLFSLPALLSPRYLCVCSLTPYVFAEMSPSQHKKVCSIIL